MPRAADSLGTRGSQTVSSRRQDPVPMNQTIHIHVASQTALQFGFLNGSSIFSNVRPLISAGNRRLPVSRAESRQMPNRWPAVLESLAPIAKLARNHSVDGTSPKNSPK